MSEFLSKHRLWLIAGGAVLFLGVILNGLENYTSTLGATASVPPTTRAREAPALAQDSAPQMFMPPPFEQRRIVPPVEGEPSPSQTAAYCDESNWSKVDLVVGRNESGSFRVDESAWNRALLGSKAGLANWMSQCQENGSAIEIIAAESGRRLAVYDPKTGLTTL